MTVLIAEDEVDLRDGMRDLLVDAGYQVMVAGNGVEAMRLMTLKRPTLVILDLLLPLASGNDVYDVMQRTPALADVPVLVATSDPTRAPVGVPTLDKPVDADVLLDTVALAVGRGYALLDRHSREGVLRRR